MMRKTFPLLPICVLLFSGCGNSSSGSPGSDSAKANVKEDSFVMHGSGAQYAYKPDSMYNNLVIGSISSFRKMWLDEGAEINRETDSTWFCLYITTGDFERVTIGLVKDKDKNVIPYSIDIRKYHNETINKNVKYLNSTEHHFMTGHGIYIGMSSAYVETVYSDQKLKYASNGDTVCLEYRPSAKDAKEYKRYSWSSVVVRYKFVDDYLRRIEYVVDPKGFINTK